MNRKVIFLLALSFILVMNSKAQHLIGMHKDDIMAYMKENKKNFKLNTGAVNKAYNYLKYENDISEQTLLYFLNENNVCSYIRLMSSYANLNDIVGELNKKHSKKNKTTWTYKEGPDVFLIELEKGEWFFTVSTKKVN